MKTVKLQYCLAKLTKSDAKKVTKPPNALAKLAKSILSH